ncbi:hypothetical protein CDAR_423431 [Caerostris darwini]|uniref:Uncharacterized protein n=1 Tax=Caerostris darwini TaxID=1538125 RepID=A0AAV4TKA9_9ARAC|nr:hypothetical protein CDAR_423431 [Caerostris darwini]
MCGREAVVYLPLTTPVNSYSVEAKHDFKPPCRLELALLEVFSTNSLLAVSFSGRVVNVGSFFQRRLSKTFGLEFCYCNVMLATFVLEAEKSYWGADAKKINKEETQPTLQIKGRRSKTRFEETVQPPWDPERRIGQLTRNRVFV